MTATYNGIGRTEEWENLRRRESPQPGLNVGRRERWISAVAAAAVTAYGLRRQRGRKLLLPVAGALLSRAVTGRCAVNGLLGRNSALDDAPWSSLTSVRRGEGIRVEQAIVLRSPRFEVYRFWRKLENLPRFMEHLEAVTVFDDRRSHWTARGPAGSRVEWDAEIHNEIPNELIAWRSLPGSEVDNAGSVHFTPDRYRGYRGACGAPVRSAGGTAGSGGRATLRRGSRAAGGGRSAPAEAGHGVRRSRVTFDCIIVGGGPAGLSAALMLGRCRRRVLLCDVGRQRNLPSKAMHGYPTRDGTEPAEFLRLARAELGRYGTIECRELEIVDATRTPAGFDVSAADGTQARRAKAAARHRRGGRAPRPRRACRALRDQRPSLSLLRRMGVARPAAGGVR